MDKKLAAAIERLKNNKGLAEQIMRSADGQKLIGMLSGADGGKTLDRAAKAAAGGDTRELSGMLKQLMNDRDAAAAMDRLNRSALEGSARH